ncbi:transposase [Paraburkholderia sp. MM5477-R1]
MKVAFADQGYPGEAPAQAARAQGIDLQVVKLDEAKKGFVLLPRRWVVERSFGWSSTAFDASHGTTNACPKHSQVCLLSSSPCLGLSMQSQYFEVPDTV